MSNNALRCNSRWVTDCELRGVWCGISRTKDASVLASIWGSTGECAVAVMNMDVVLCVLTSSVCCTFCDFITQCGMCGTENEWPCHILWSNTLYRRASSCSTKEMSVVYWRITDDGLTCFLAGRRLYHQRHFPTTDIRLSLRAELLHHLSSLISRSSKLQIYRTLVRPVVTYGSESWTLSMEEERALALFERKILRKIYGPVKENELWRIRRNDELEAIIKGENIVRFINP